MKYKCLIIEKKEYLLLKRFMYLSEYLKNNTLRNSMLRSLEMLESAQINNEKDMPTDVIRFNSLITISSINGCQKIVRLVIPSESDDMNKISILTPKGIAMMGHAEGDYFGWNLSPEEPLMKIEKVEQYNEDISNSLVY